MFPFFRVANVRRNSPLTPPATPTLPPKSTFFSESALDSCRDSDETATTSGGRNGSTSSSSSNCGNNGTTTSPASYLIDNSRPTLFQYHHLPPRKLRNRWKTYLQPNYNSPRKTIFTIMLLIGAVLFTQLPLSLVLFTSTVETTQRWFQFCISVLFSTSSVANPVLYGFLNRSIRDQLWRLVKRKSHMEHGPSAASLRKRKRGQQHQLEEMAQTSKNFLSSANQHHLHNIYSPQGKTTSVEIPGIKISRKESVSSEENSFANSTGSINSINAISSTATSFVGATDIKTRANQVQKRVPSSPYYRSVLLKKANSSGGKRNSLLPRVALPDVNVRRNSSGSIVTIRTNGNKSMKKGEIKKIQEEWPFSCSNKCNGNDQTNQFLTEVHVEMQTFRNSSRAGLQSSQIDINSENVNVCQDSKIICVESDNPSTIGMSTQNSSECQVYKVGDDGIISESTRQPVLTESCESENNGVVPQSYIMPDKSVSVVNKPGPSREHSTYIPEPPDPDDSEKLGTCLSVESLMGVLIDDESLPESFPRKPSQDSGKLIWNYCLQQNEK